MKVGFCIYITTVCEGAVPLEYDGEGFPVVYSTKDEAERVIAEETIDRLKQFLCREREFDDAMTVEEYIVEVDVFPDGSIIDHNDSQFGKKDW